MPETNTDTDLIRRIIYTGRLGDIVKLFLRNIDDIPWVNSIWLWAERDVLLAAVATLVFLISFVWSSLILKKYYSYSHSKHSEPSSS